MFSKQTAMIVVLIVLMFLSIVFLSLSSRQSYPAHGPGRLAIAIVAPFQKTIMSTVRYGQDVWRNYFFLVSIAEDNDRMRKELHQLRALKHQHEELRQANERLRALLSLGQEIQRPVIAAQVVGKDPSPWFQTILVDKGRADGVEIGLPVITTQGVVGLVVEAAGGYAKVVLITDPNSAVDAMVQSNRARGIIKGGTSGYCVLNYVLRHHDLNVGDTVVSSGMDGVFPKGMPIGRVSGIIKNIAGLFQDVTVTPYVDFERLEEVLIVPKMDNADPS
jgi:rod shape-determining protein MreC